MYLYRKHIGVSAAQRPPQDKPPSLVIDGSPTVPLLLLSVPIFVVLMLIKFSIVTSSISLEDGS